MRHTRAEWLVREPIRTREGTSGVLIGLSVYGGAKHCIFRHCEREFCSVQIYY